MCPSKRGDAGVSRDIPDVPERYRHIGQPVIIPGDMGRSSWVLVGQPASMEKAFGTTCHGAGRVMSRTKPSGMPRAAGSIKNWPRRESLPKREAEKRLAEEQPTPIRM